MNNNIKYYLQQIDLGKPEKIELNECEYEILLRSKHTLISALAIEEKYDLLISNYLELEQDALNLAIELMVNRPMGYEGYAEKIQLINRRVVNLLTSTRLYIDHTKQNIKNCLSETTNYDVNKIFSEKYDESFSYRFMEALRNYVQHCGLAVHRASTPIKTIKYDKLDKLSHSMKFYSVKEKFLETKKFKVAVLNEMPDSVELIQASRSYVSSLNYVHLNMRGEIKDEVEQARKQLKSTIDNFCKVTNEKNSGLYAIKQDVSLLHDSIIEKVAILLNWDDTRLKLEERNKKMNTLDSNVVIN